MNKATAFHVREQLFIETKTWRFVPVLLSTMSQSKGEVQLPALAKTATLWPIAALSVQYSKQQGLVMSNVDELEQINHT